MVAELAGGLTAMKTFDSFANVKLQRGLALQLWLMKWIGVHTVGLCPSNQDNRTCQ